MKKVLEDGKKKDAQDNIVDYIIRLNKKCNFPSSMYIEKFFASVNIKDSFEVTNNEKYYIKVLQNFNDLFYIKSYLSWRKIALDMMRFLKKVLILRIDI